MDSDFYAASMLVLSVRSGSAFVSLSSVPSFISVVFVSVRIIHIY